MNPAEAAAADSQGPVVETSATALDAPVLAASMAFATISITSVPDSAEIYVDGKFLGNTPATLRLPAGAHTIVLKSSGFPDYSRTLDLPKSSKLSLKADFMTAEGPQ